MPRFLVFAFACFGLSGIAFSSFSTPEARLMWNRTASAPTGLYWLTDGPLTVGRWAVLSANSEPAGWAEARGHAGRDWPLLKRIVGVEGDEICRIGPRILLNGDAVAEALERDSVGRKMPEWSGCFTLETSDYFLLNDHPASLDGRYFGPVDAADIARTAIPVWTK